MNLGRCNKCGRFYNAEKFSSCPTCIGIENEDEEDTLNPFEDNDNILGDEEDTIMENDEQWNASDYIIKDDDCIVQMEYSSVKIFRNRAKVVKKGNFELKNQRMNVLIELNDVIDKVNVRTSRGLVCYSKSKVKCMKNKKRVPNDSDLNEKQKENSLYRKYEFIKKRQKDILVHDYAIETLKEYDEIKKVYENLLEEENELIKNISHFAYCEKDNSDLNIERYAGKKMLKLDMLGEPGEKYFIEIEYETYDISWEPYYKIYVSSDSQYAIMTMFAKIVNRDINEKLDNVKIILSSGVNAYTNDMNEDDFDIQYIKKKFDSENMDNLVLESAHKMDIENIGIQKSVNAEMRRRGMERKLSEDMFEMNPVNIRENNSEILHEFELPWRMTLLTGEHNEVAVWQKKVGVYKKYYAIPRKNKNEYFSVEFTNLKEYELLSGWLEIYFESDYVRKYFIEITEVNHLKIDMGRVKGVKINSRKVVDEESTKKLQGKIIRKYKYIFEIVNDLQKTISLKLFDQIPISKAEGVEVLLKRIDGIEVEEMTGRCTWNVKVEPLSVRKIAFEYAISYPMKEKFVIE